MVLEWNRHSNTVVCIHPCPCSCASAVGSLALLLLLPDHGVAAVQLVHQEGQDGCLLLRRMHLEGFALQAVADFRLKPAPLQEDAQPFRDAAPVKLDLRQLLPKDFHRLDSIQVEGRGEKETIIGKGFLRNCNKELSGKSDLCFSPTPTRKF